MTDGSGAVQTALAADATSGQSAKTTTAAIDDTDEILERLCVARGDFIRD